MVHQEFREEGLEGVREKEGDKEAGVNDGQHDEVDESGGIVAKPPLDPEPDQNGTSIA